MVREDLEGPMLLVTVAVELRGDEEQGHRDRNAEEFCHANGVWNDTLSRAKLS